MKKIKVKKNHVHGGSRDTKSPSTQHTGERAEVRKEKGAQTWDTDTRGSRGASKASQHQCPHPKPTLRLDTRVWDV